MVHTALIYKNPDQSALVVGYAHDRIIRAVGRYHFLTARQVVRLFYADASLVYVQKLLKRLAAEGFLQRLYLPRLSPSGSVPAVYTLARRGLTYLASDEHFPSKRYRPAEQREHSFLFLAHTLSVNDFFITTELLCRQVQHFELAAMVHDLVLKHSPVSVTLLDGTTAKVIPDGWLQLHDHGRGEEISLCLELDRGTMERRRFQDRIRAYLAFAAGPYQAAFQTTGLTVCILATTGPNRAADIRSWIEAVLRTEHRETDADLFRVSSRAADSTPSELFFASCWDRPFTPLPLPLLLRPSAEGGV